MLELALENPSFEGLLFFFVSFGILALAAYGALMLLSRSKFFARIFQDERSHPGP